MIRGVVSDAIANRLNDPRIAPMTSVTRVEVSHDLENAKVWVSVMGEEAVQRRTIAGLTSALGHVRRLVARELSIRHCPRLQFCQDVSISQGAETIRLIDETMASMETDANSPEGESPGDRSGLSSGDDV